MRRVSTWRAQCTISPPNRGDKEVRVYGGAVWKANMPPRMGLLAFPVVGYYKSPFPSEFTSHENGPGSELWSYSMPIRHIDYFRGNMPLLTELFACGAFASAKFLNSTEGGPPGLSPSLPSVET